MLTLGEILDDFSLYAGLVTGTVTVNTRSSIGETPLHWMATLGDVAGIELLVRAGANVNCQDLAGDTPLHLAVTSRQLAAARVLIGVGASKLQNGNGLTPEDLAQDAGGPAMASLFAKS